ncbi:MAG: HPr family phosphocarrier protein [Anaerolineales bacterium]|nr:HPr family phosphocarrier protein [Anaerolineales bacterium]
MTKSLEITIHHEDGLHLRPAAMFMEVANGFLSQITVKNLSKETEATDAKSQISLMLAAVQANDQIRITAEGEDEDEALAALRDLIEGDFIQPT